MFRLISGLGARRTLSFEGLAPLLGPSVLSFEGLAPLIGPSALSFEGFAPLLGPSVLSFEGFLAGDFRACARLLRKSLRITLGGLLLPTYIYFPEPGLCIA